MGLSEIVACNFCPKLPARTIYNIYRNKTRGKWEVGVNRRNHGMGKCVTNAASTTDWPHLVASSTYNDAMQ